jgi:hypothetical protein
MLYSVTIRKSTRSSIISPPRLRPVLHRVSQIGTSTNVLDQQQTNSPCPDTTMRECQLQATVLEQISDVVVVVDNNFHITHLNRVAGNRNPGFRASRGRLFRWKSSIWGGVPAVRQRQAAAGLAICKGIIEAHGGSMRITRRRAFTLKLHQTMKRPHSQPA